MPLLTPAFAGGSFSATRDISVNFGSAADRGLLVLVFNEGNITPGGTPISSCVIDPAGANLAMTSGLDRDSIPIISPGGRLRAFWAVGPSVPTGTRTVRVTCADGNGKPQIWALPFDGFSGASAETLSNGSTATPSITVPSAAGSTVVAFVHGYSHPDSTTIVPAAPATLVRRVVVADNPVFVGAIWQEPGAVSTVVDGAWTGPGPVWGIVGWSLTPSAGGDTTPPVITGPGGATGSTATASTTAPVTAVHTYTANETVTWSLNGGANVGLFAVNSSTGALSFSSAPSAGTYVVGVRATDAAGNATTQTLTLTVAAAGDTTPPVITGPGGATGSTATASLSAGATAVHTYTANESVTWDINGGANAGLFAINATTGALVFSSAATAGTYVVGVRATDAAGNATTQTLTATVTAGAVFGFDLHTLPGCRLTSFAGSGAALNSEVGTQVVVTAHNAATGALVATSGTLTADANSRLPRWTHAALANATAYVLLLWPQDGRQPYAIRLTAT